MDKKLLERLNALETINETNIVEIMNSLEYNDYTDYLNMIYEIYRFVVLRKHYEVINCIDQKVVDIIDKVYDKTTLAKGYSIIISFSTLNDFPERAVEYGLKFEEIRSSLGKSVPYQISIYSSLAAVFYRSGLLKDAVKYTEKMFLVDVFENYSDPIKASQYINYISMEPYIENREFFEAIKSKLFKIFETNKSDDIKNLYVTYELILIELRNRKAIEENNTEELEKVMEDFEKIATFEEIEPSRLIEQKDNYISILKTFFKFGKYQYVIEKCKHLIDSDIAKGIDLIELYKLLIESLEQIVGEANHQIMREYTQILSKYYETQTFLKKQMVQKSVELFHLEKEVKTIIRIDPLTACFNRRYLDEFIDSNAVDTKAIIYFDIDDFKMVNDKFGHKIGDIVLVSFVEAVNGYLPKNSALFRMGGDEFVLVSSLGTMEENEEMIFLIKKRFASICRKTEFKRKIDFSYGIYIDSTIDKNNIYEKIDRADELMYKNKMPKKALK